MIGIGVGVAAVVGFIAYYAMKDKPKYAPPPPVG
jgi:hypothetical protein